MRPHALIREQVDTRATARTIEVFPLTKRVAAHARRYGGQRHSTLPEHIPSTHTGGMANGRRSACGIRPVPIRTEHRGADPPPCWSAAPHPEQGFRTCLGVLRLFRGIDPARAEAVSLRAIEIGALTYASVASILKHRIDQSASPRAADGTPLLHDNIRGSRYRWRPTLLKHQNALSLLDDLGLHGMAKGFRDLADNPEYASAMRSGWAFCWSARARCASRSGSKTAPGPPGCVMWPRSRMSTTGRRAVSTALLLKLASCDWIREHRHCLLTGPSGVGKSWLACALGYKACRENLSVLYQRMHAGCSPRAGAARGDGRYAAIEAIRTGRSADP